MAMEQKQPRLRIESEAFAHYRLGCPTAGLHINLEEMFEWIVQKTPPTAVFAGPMPTMANLLLSTGQIYHPVGLRTISGLFGIRYPAEYLAFIVGYRISSKLRHFHTFSHRS